MLKDGIVTFWEVDNYLRLAYVMNLGKNSQKIIFESSFRFLASLKTEGGVDIWKIKGSCEKPWWSLNFDSIKDLVNNDSKENQFILSMNSTDDLS